MQPGACDFTLGPAAVLSGRVRLTDGKPAVRVRVCAQSAGDGNSWITTRSEDDRSFRLIGLHAGRYNVWAKAEDLTIVAHDSVTAEIDRETKLDDLVLIAGGFVTGRIVDADTGKPLQPGGSSDVVWYGPSRLRSGSACDCTPIQLDGTFRLRVPPGQNHLYLRAIGFDAVGSDSIDVEVTAGAEQKIEFRVRSSKSKAK